ncbi:DUF885 domain-containing protein [Herbivorax sp. ANBcel31]|uniref:DUF885 domain-containing protein n=1 Tax=Herbivorax sp. ANBcel31 TaxID=3069754 RepID=UPI0027B5BC12|nr:DUF885 domain-containing protein [Herbivorax sp. ANBcel31]MDQ2087535.1 DUF885 domain-containing protein [Herbivorax sp. ANBcel31]
MQPIKKTILLILIFTLAITTFGCSETDDNLLLEKFMEDTFLEELKANPSMINLYLLHPENYGLEDVEMSLPDILNIEENNKRYKSYLNKLDKINYENLSKDNQLQYDIIKYHYSSYADLELQKFSETASPIFGIQAQAPLLLGTYRTEIEKEFEDYLNLLKDLPRLIDDLIELHQQKAEDGLLMPSIQIRDVITQSRNFIADKDNHYLITSFNERKGLENVDSDKANEYIEKNREIVLNKVIPAYDNLKSAFNDLMRKTENEKGLYYFENGKEYYEQIARINSGSSKSIDEIITAIDNKLIDSLSEISVIEESKSVSYSLTDSPKETINMIKDSMYDDYPSILEPELYITSLPHILEGRVGGYYIQPTIDVSTKNTVLTRRDMLQDLNMYIDLAHEAYPGHLYQFNYALQLDLPDIRHVLGFPGYTEGWAVSTEFQALNYIDLPEWVKIKTKHTSIINRLLFARIDIGVHYQGWTIEQVKQYIDNTSAGQIPSSAASVHTWNRVITSPGFSLPYGIGYLEMAEMRDKAEDTLDENFDLKEFHRFILDMGPAPFEIINEYFEDWLYEQVDVKKES